MPIRIPFILLISATLLRGGVAFSQIPVELFAGDKKATVDLMFFRFIKNRKDQNSKWLLFNRNRAGITYAMTGNSNLPQFGFTEAVSFNDNRFRGFAPVAVASILNSGIYPKAGIQFVKTKTSYTFFSWIVTETKRDPNIDFFLLLRFTANAGMKSHIFTQLELVNSFPTFHTNNYSFVQRMRAGLKIKAFQFGAGADFTALGRSSFTFTQNTGGFLRYEF